MIDGKVCNVLTGQKSTTSCNICGVNLNYINDLQYIKKLKINKEHYKFGLSTFITGYDLWNVYYTFRII